MGEFFDLFVSFWHRILILLDQPTFVIYGREVSLLGLLGAFLIISLVISVFWRGARA